MNVNNDTPCMNVWFMYVCMYVCMYVSMYVYILCICVRVHGCILKYILITKPWYYCSD